MGSKTIVKLIGSGFNKYFSSGSGLQLFLPTPPCR